jgi:hypothetical protein
VTVRGRDLAGAQNFDPSTREAVEGRFRRHVYSQLGGRQFRQVRPSTIQAWLRGLGLADSTTKVVFANLSTLFAAAVNDELIGRNPCRSLRTQSEGRAARTPAVDQADLTELHPQVRRSGEPSRRAGGPRHTHRPAATFLDACVVAGLNILVAGGTQAGKTTIVNPCAETYVRHIKRRDRRELSPPQRSLGEGSREEHSPCPQPSHHLSPTAMGGRNC